MHSTETAASAPKPGVEGQRRPRLLCIDDSASVRSQVVELFQDWYDIELATNGLEGLQAAKAHPPDVVLSDYEMPELNGLQLLLAMKNDPALRAIPFLVFTAKAYQSTVTKCLNAGADDFLSKSCSAAELRARVAAAARSYRRYQLIRAEHQDLTRVVALFAGSEARLRAIVQNAPSGVIQVAADGIIEALNRAAERMFGCGQAEVVGRRFPETLFTPESCRTLSHSLLQRAAGPPGAGAEPQRRQVQGLRSGRHPFAAECSLLQTKLGAEVALCAFVWEPGRH
jgi:PAS domain S-box-containing protein